MKSLDSLSKRILIIAFSISLILLSLSAFLLTVSRVTAKPMGAINETYIGLGVDDNFVYYASFQSREVYKIPKSRAKVNSSWY